MPDLKIAENEKDLSSCSDCKSPEVYKIIDTILKDGNINETFKEGVCNSCYYELLGGRWA